MLEGHSLSTGSCSSRLRISASIVRVGGFVWTRRRPTGVGLRWARRGHRVDVESDGDDGDVLASARVADGKVKLIGSVAAEDFSTVQNQIEKFPGL